MFINLMACEFLTVIIWLRLYQMQPSSNWVATFTEKCQKLVRVMKNRSRLLYHQNNSLKLITILILRSLNVQIARTNPVSQDCCGPHK